MLWRRFAEPLAPRLFIPFKLNLVEVDLDDCHTVENIPFMNEFSVDHCRLLIIAINDAGYLSHRVSICSRSGALPPIEATSEGLVP